MAGLLGSAVVLLQLVMLCSFINRFGEGSISVSSPVCALYAILGEEKGCIS